MSVLTASASAAFKRNFASSAKAPRLLSGRTLAPTVNYNSSAGLKVRLSEFSAPIGAHANYVRFYA